MKKSIKIATLGVAALGFAAMPVLGASAAIDPSSATTQLTLEVTATDSISSTAAVNLGTIALGTDTDKSATGTVSVNWHDAKKYDVTYAGSSLTATGGNTPFAATTSAIAPTAQQWGLSKDGGSAWLSAASGSLLSNVATKGNDQLTTITYKAVANDSTEAGSYSGNIVYTLAQAQGS